MNETIFVCMFDNKETACFIMCAEAGETDNVYTRMKECQEDIMTG